MKKIICLMLAMMMFVLLASVAFSEDQGTDMYVYTKNGKVLKVRSSMSTKDDSNVIGTLSYGAKVIIYGHKDGWAIIDYGNSAAYVMLKLFPSVPLDADLSAYFGGSETAVVQAVVCSLMVALPALYQLHRLLDNPQDAEAKQEHKIN